jgi:hypothetical protein
MGHLAPLRNVPNLNDPALPIGALALRHGMVPPADGGMAVGDYLVGAVYTS